MNSRLKDIFLKLKAEGLDALLISLSPNITYLSEYISRDSYLLISNKNNFYFTDSRYTQEAKECLQGFAKIKRVNGSLFKSIADTCLGLNIKRLGFEERNLPFAEYAKIKEELNKQAKLVPTCDLVESLRQIKSPKELSKIQEAVRITIEAFKFIENFIEPGKKEIEIAAELERFIRYKGATGAAFDIIVATGPNSSLPHHITSQRIASKGEPVLIDMGVDYQGYKSDLTRVFFLGKISSLLRRGYDIVKKAQEEAISQIKPGAAIKKVDLAARQYISQNGYGGFFGHNTGHGVGLEVHEAPHISKNNLARIEPGMVFTLEPAIYLPGKFGVRIEDMVRVTPKGAELISGALNK